MINTARHIDDIRKWKHVETKPKPYTLIEVCDADYDGWADFNFYAYYEKGKYLVVSQFQIGQIGTAKMRKFVIWQIRNDLKTQTRKLNL